jgi:hypothetical protein
MARHKRPHRRQVNALIFADQPPFLKPAKRRAALVALQRNMIAHRVRRLAKRAEMPLVAGLAAARLRILPPLLAVKRRRQRLSLRRLLRALQLQNQINQLILAQPLQIRAFHAGMDSGLCAFGKGRVITECQVSTTVLVQVLRFKFKTALQVTHRIIAQLLTIDAKSFGKSIRESD